MKISQFKNKNGQPIHNQFILYDSEYTVFQSYNSIIVKIIFENGKQQVYLDINTWNYSKTTTKYRNQFLSETTKQTQAKIDNGIYKLVDLN